MAQTKIIEPIQKLLKTEDRNPHKVCAYCRVSTDETDQKNSLTAQKQFFHTYFQYHKNWTNVGIYADEGLSGTSLEKRDDFNRMLIEARSGNIDIILTKEVSRFSRNVQHLLNIVEELRHNGIYIWFLSDDINTESSNYREKLTQVATNAEQESLRTSRRVKWGHQQKMQFGVVFGRKRMYGYHIIKDETGTQHFQVISEEAAFIRNIFEWFAAGDGTHRIARRLEQLGIQTKQHKQGWTNTVILRILRNEKYVGDLAQGKTFTPDPLTHKKRYNRGQARMIYIQDHHPEAAIISRELWNKVQKILLQKSSGKETKPTYSNRYWASGKVYCGLCGRRYIRYIKKQKNNSYHAWICVENHQRGRYKQITRDNGETAFVGCNAQRVNNRVLKTAIYDILSAYIFPQKEQLLKDLTAEIKQCQRQSGKHMKIAAIEKKIIQAEKQLAKLTQGWLNGTVPETAYQVSIGPASAKYENLQKELTKLQAEPCTSNSEIHENEKNFDQIRSMLSLSETDLVDGFLERVTRRITIYPDNLMVFDLSFIPVPVCLQYVTSGRGESYKTEITILTNEQFEEADHRLKQ